MSDGAVAPGRSRSWRGLVGVLAAQGVAWTGTRLSAIALPWFVLSTTGSATRTGLVVLAQMGPYVVVQALAGPLIDRIGPRRVSIVCDSIAFTAMAMVPLLYLLDLLSLWTLLGLMAVVGSADGPANASKSVFIPHVTTAARVPLERGTGLAGSLERLAGTIGPAIAGLVVAAAGGVFALWITAALFGLGAVIIAVAIPGPDRANTAHNASGATGVEAAGDGDAAEAGGYFAQLRQGAAFLRGDRLLRSIAGMVAVTNLLDAAFVAVLLPVWAKESGHGPEVIGLIVSVMSGFAILTSLLAAAYGHRMPRRLVYVVGFLIAGAPRFVVLAVGAPLWVIVAVYAVAGASSGVINPILGAIQFERIPAGLLGRVKTLTHAAAWSGIPFGGIVGGVTVTALGLAPTLLVFGGVYLVTTLLPGLQKEWQEMRKVDREQSTV